MPLDSVELCPKAVVNHLKSIQLELINNLQNKLIGETFKLEDGSICEIKASGTRIDVFINSAISSEFTIVQTGWGCMRKNPTLGD